MTEKNKNQPKPTTAAEAPKRRTRSRKTALTLRQELLTELERMALGDEEAPRDKLKAMEEIDKDLHILLAKASCKGISKEEIYVMIDEIYDEYGGF